MKKLKNILLGLLFAALTIPSFGQDATLVFHNGQRVYYESGGGGGSTLLNDLVAYYDFEEASGDLLDQTDNNYDGTIVGSNTTRQQTGIINYCYSFNGGTDGDYIEIGANIITGTPFTVSMWVYSDPGTDQRTIISGDDANAFTLNLEADDRFRVRRSGGTPSTGETDPIAESEWEHLVFTWASNNDYELWVNGVSGYSASGMDATLVWTSDERIGANHNGNQFEWDGYLDEIGIWSRVLTDDEIAELYNSNSGITYPFD
jgi:hypothetical protein